MQFNVRRVGRVYDGTALWKKTKKPGIGSWRRGTKKEEERPSSVLTWLTICSVARRRESPFGAECGANSACSFTGKLFPARPLPDDPCRCATARTCVHNCEHARVYIRSPCKWTLLKERVRTRRALWRYRENESSRTKRHIWAILREKMITAWMTRERERLYHWIIYLLRRRRSQYPIKKNILFISFIQKSKVKYLLLRS